AVVASPSLSMNRTRNSLEMNETIKKGSWPQLTSNFWRCSLSMNRVPSGGFGLKNHVVLACELLEQALFGVGNFLFVFFQSLFHVAGSVNHQTPEQFGQLACQRQIGHQSALAALEPSIKPTEGFVDAPSHAPRHHAKQPSGPIARTALAASAFATISAARRQSQPRREVLLGLPVFLQVAAHFAEQLQEHVVGYPRQLRGILTPTQPPQQPVQTGNVRRIDPTAFDRRRSRILRILRPGQFFQDRLNGLVALGDLLL